MTAVASPPAFQPLPRWNTGNGGQRGLDPMSADEVSRMFMNRKGVQRTNSSSSVASSSSGSSTYTISATPSQTNAETPVANGDQGGWGPRKKPAKGIWPSSKSEPVSGISATRPIPIPTTSSGQSASSTMSAIHQPSPIVSSTNRLQSQPQQNGGRMEPSANQGEPPVVLALLPMTGTFERKHITIPYFPEVLRIGRQTNAKTVPTPVNGYFDSKVLSRQHAEVWADRNGKVWIRDVKSSNGTFVNGVRLSPENRDSEPHELREHDTLELGIDIVSEDQKSIVHHKVSAKVEHAGVYGNSSNVLDLNFGDMDPNTGNGLMGTSIGQPMSQIRARGGQGSMASNGRLSGPPSMIGAGLNVMGPQRQMNFWMNPITIEQVVKKLTTELKQAKQQSQDLHRTGEFFNTLLTSEPGKEPTKPLSEIPVEQPQPNAISPAAQLDAISPFSEPPVPPPQQPLPEKPDIARFHVSDPFPQTLLERTDTQRPGSIVSSPGKSDPPSSQILSLVEALTIAKREIDSQGDRMKHLETLLHNERKARESAEERARRLLESQISHNAQQNGTAEEAVQPTLNFPKKTEPLLINGCDNHHEEKPFMHSLRASAESQDPEKNAEEPHSNSKLVDAETSRLQEKLDLMVQEMDEMKALMESYKHRAVDAEQERKTLAEIVEQIRTDDLSRSQISRPSSFSDEGNHTTSPKTNLLSHPGSSSNRKISDTIPTKAILPARAQQEGVRNEIMPEGINTAQEVADQHTPSTMLRRQRERWDGGGGDIALQSAPYISMVGVVLIGVGIMTWLNGWQKCER